MRKSTFYSVLLVVLMTFSVNQGQAQSLGGLLKKPTASPTTGNDTSNLGGQQDELVKRFVSGFENLTAGQAQAARALGLKEEADKLESERDALRSGNVRDKDGIKRTMRVTRSAQDKIDEKLAEGFVLDDEAKKELAKALPFYARGTADTIQLIPVAIKWSTSAISAIKGAGIMGALKLKKRLGTGLYIAKSLPGYVRNAKNSYQTLMAFSRKNEIDTSEAEDLLGDL